MSGPAHYLPVVYANLRAIASSYLEREGPDHTLQPTALVHEAYVRLADRDGIDWKGKTHFLAVAATEMRRVLVDHARAAGAAKRGAAARRITLDESLDGGRELSIEILALDEALDRLASVSSRQARVAQLRIYVGMSSHEIGDALGVSERTASGDWRMARAWLARELHSRGRR